MKGEGGGVGCELCGAAARIYCDSDRASLCWGCDHKVHGANFLVGKHTRCLLCHRCQSPTPWTASGPKIPPCMSLCLSCLALVSQPPQQPHHPPHDLPHQEEGEEEGYGSYTDDDDDDDDDDNHDDDDENQVVPWTASSSPPSSTNKAGTSVSLSSTTDDEDDDEDDEAEYENEDEDEDEDDVNAKSGLVSSTSLKRKRETGFQRSSHRNTLPRL